MYDLATDSAGKIHLLAVGRERPTVEAPLGVYHLVWDGQSWSAPYRVFVASGLLPEYPKIVIHRGNQLHAAWFTRDGDAWDQSVDREVWYSRSQTAAPDQPMSVVANPTVDMGAPTSSATPMATGSPAQTRVVPGGLPDGLYTETDDVLKLLLALSPIILLVAGILAIRGGWFGRLRR
jgi:hypothetical protein